ncbi:MAG: hypothetical protein OEM05_06960 [Myxococcales bacterium]|nr:hypothetical protein [Myxococcales bacterium]
MSRGCRREGIALLSVFVAVSALAVGSGARAETRVLRAIPYAQGVEVRQAVRDECQLETKVPGYIAQFGSDVVLVDQLGGGRVLELAITEVHAGGGGSFSGPMWMTVTGTLREGRRVVGTFRAKRFTTGGAFAGFKGTCSIIGRSTKAIGRDIAAWLENPGMDSKLGDAR